MSNGGTPSGHRGGDDIYNKPDLPFLSTWMSHWSGAACYGPKLSLRYESDGAGSAGTKENEGSSGFVDGRDNLMLGLASSGTANSDSKSGKKIDGGSRASSNRPILDLSISSPVPTDELQRLPTNRCMNLFPNESTSLDGKLFRGFCNWSRGVQRLPPSPKDGETMRIFTTIDTIAAGSSRGAPTFSQTTRHFMFTKTDVKVPRVESSTASDFNEKVFREFLTLSTEALIPPEKDKDKYKLICDSKNESSADTDALELEDEKAESRLPISLFSATPVREEHSELPDMNKEIPAETDREEEDDASTSRTASLDADLLFFDSTMKSGFSTEKEMNEEHRIRWVKRLKPSSSMEFGYGTKSGEVEERSPLRKSLSLFRNALRCEKAESDAERMDESVALRVSCKNEWIKRWSCRGGKNEEKNEETKGAERGEEDDVSKDGKQFPSIAAMALMGKAMKGLRQCAYRRKGSVMLWNADDIYDDEIR